MRKVTRRTAMGVTAVAVAAALGDGAAADNPEGPRMFTVEGELRVHSKFLYRYFLVLLDGQKLALYGPDHGREPASLARIQLPGSVRVRGVLGTEQHRGTPGNPSPFPNGWIVYMDVHEVEPLK